jgi:hypothetical protein
VACAGVTLNAVATAPCAMAHVRAEGDIDFRGILGVDKEAPVGFQNIRRFFDLDSEATEELLVSHNTLIERYSVVFQTLQNSPLIETSYPIVQVDLLQTSHAGLACSQPDNYWKHWFRRVTNPPCN